MLRIFFTELKKLIRINRLPLVILLAMGYVGSGFMDAIYETSLGRVVATIGLVIFIVSFFMSRKISNIKV